jgi:hypothetical protein
MKVKIKVEQEVEIKYLQAKAEVRYWEDATIDGVEDEDGTLTPCRDGDLWCPLIDIDTGKITNWKEGVEADIHFKVCDAGTYQLLDENKKVILEKEGYVPDIMCPEGAGYGDYIIMKIDKDGIIANWDAEDIDDFTDDEE